MEPVRVLGQHFRAIDTPEKTIDELTGASTTKEDRFSVARINASASEVPEPFRVSKFDEWFIVLEGTLELEYASGDGTSTVTVEAGSTAVVNQQTTFRPRHPVACVAFAVCMPSFRLDRSTFLQGDDDAAPAAPAATDLPTPAADGGGGSGGGAATTDAEVVVAEPAAPALPEMASPEVLYHMCPRAAWESAKVEAVYYPATFEKDGFFTHATGVPSRLITTANHFYQDSPGDWVRTRRRACMHVVMVVVRCGCS